jgi:hypothetical protein
MHENHPAFMVASSSPPPPVLPHVFKQMFRQSVMILSLAAMFKTWKMELFHLGTSGTKWAAMYCDLSGRDVLQFDSFRSP